MSLFNFGKKKEPAPAPEPIPLDYPTPKKDIKCALTFTQNKSFKGFRRARVSMGTSEVVWNNIDYFRDCGYDFTNSAVQVLVLRSDTDPGVQLKILVDGRYLGNVYQSNKNAEIFDAVTSKKVDKVHIKVEDTVIDGKYYGTETFLMFHWPDMGPKSERDCGVALPCFFRTDGSMFGPFFIPRKKTRGKSEPKIPWS